MERHRNHEKTCSIIKRMKNHRNTQEKLEAYMLDYMQRHPELTPEPPSPPPGEFQRILAELDKRGTKTVVSRQLTLLNYGYGVIKSLQKPLIIIMVVLVLATMWSIGISSKKSYDYQLRESKVMEIEKNWNHDRNSSVYEKKISDSYEENNNKNATLVSMCS